MENIESKSYDLVVIGGGPAGLVGAVTAAALGRSVVVVDSQTELGGAGVNTGTVPSKTLRETALALPGCGLASYTGLTFRCGGRQPSPTSCATNGT